MAYTQDLINEVKELYPNSTEIIRAAESGSVFLGRYLDDSSTDSMKLKEILNANSLQELQAEAKRRQRKLDLYKKWGEQDPRPKIY